MKKIILSLAVAAMALSTTVVAQGLDTLFLKPSVQTSQVDTGQDTLSSSFIQTSKTQINVSTVSAVATVVAGYEIMQKDIPKGFAPITIATTTSGAVCTLVLVASTS